MALTANRDVDHYVDQELRTFAVDGGANVFKGALLGMNPEGYAGGAVAGARFCGIAYEACDNSAGAAGDKAVRAYTLGDFALTVAGVQQSDVLKPVFAVDDAAASLTAGPAESFIGHIVGVADTNVAIVRLGPLGARGHAQVEFFDDFLGAVLNVTDGAWKTVDVGDATESVVSDGPAGQFALALAATSEAEDAVLYHGDVKQFDIDSKVIFECRAKVATPGTGVTVVFGMAGDHNLDKDSVAQHAWFRLQAGLDLLVESDDGVNDNDDADTGVNLTTDTFAIFRIDLTDPSDVKFYINGVRALASTTFDMSGYSGRTPLM
jgi:hypothetical protein